MKVVNLNATSFEQVMSSIREAYEKGDAIAFAMTKKDLGEIHTGYVDADVGTKQELIGHLQADVMMEMVRINFVEEG